MIHSPEEHEGLTPDKVQDHLDQVYHGRFDYSLWPPLAVKLYLRGHDREYTGNFEHDRLVAFHDAQHSDDEARASLAPLTPTRVPGYISPRHPPAAVTVERFPSHQRQIRRNRRRLGASMAVAVVMSGLLALLPGRWHYLALVPMGYVVVCLIILSG